MRLRCATWAQLHRSPPTWSRSPDALQNLTGPSERPAVSRYARLLREHFEASGLGATRPAWAPARGRAAFALTHDVDHPEIFRSLEWLR